MIVNVDRLGGVSGQGLLVADVLGLLSVLTSLAPLPREMSVTE